MLLLLRPQPRCATHYCLGRGWQRPLQSYLLCTNSELPCTPLLQQAPLEQRLLQTVSTVGSAQEDSDGWQREAHRESVRAPESLTTTDCVCTHSIRRSCCEAEQRWQQQSTTETAVSALMSAAQVLDVTAATDRACLLFACQVCEQHLAPKSTQQRPQSVCHTD
jgi:hypothetical protein